MDFQLARESRAGQAGSTEWSKEVSPEITMSWF
jgi:hypothetical protein